MNTNKRRILMGMGIGLGVLIVLIVVIAVAGGGSENGTSATQTETRATATPRSESPSPTSTPRPRPTSTPTPSCPTTREEVYFVALGGYISEISEISFVLGDLMLEMSYDPSVILDDSWTIDFAVGIVELNTVAEGILELGVPSSVSKISAPAESAARKILRATDLFVQGIDEVDPDAIGEATDLIISAGNDITAVGSARESFCE